MLPELAEKGEDIKTIEPFCFQHYHVIVSSRLLPPQLGTYSCLVVACKQALNSGLINIITLAL